MGLKRGLMRSLRGSDCLRVFCSLILVLQELVRAYTIGFTG